MGSYRFLFGDLRTGKISRTISMIGGSWTGAYDQADSIAARFPLSAQQPATGIPEWQFVDSDTSPAKQFMVTEWVGDDGKLEQVCGGPIWTRNHNDDTDELTLGAADLVTIFDHRLVLPSLVAGMKPEEQSILMQGAELGLLAKRLVEVAVAHVGGSLPIVLPSDADLGGSGTRYGRSHRGYELPFVGERLKHLSEVENGPEIKFVPRRNPADERFMQWVLRVGRPATNMMLHQPGGPHILDQKVPDSAVLSISTAETAADVATTTFAAGQGEGRGKPIEWSVSSELTDLGYPALHRVVGDTDSVIERPTLQAHSRGLLAQSNRPIRTHTATIQADTFWKIAPGFRPGDYFMVRPRVGHKFLLEETIMRSLQASGGGDTISLQMAPVKGFI